MINFRKFRISTFTSVSSLWSTGAKAREMRLTTKIKISFFVEFGVSLFLFFICIAEAVAWGESPGDCVADLDVIFGDYVRPAAFLRHAHKDRAATASLHF